MTYVIGYSEFSYPSSNRESLKYKTDVFEITSGTSISEIYNYFENPSIYVRRNVPENHIWGEESTDYDQVSYTTFKSVWTPVSLPKNPIVLKWKINECDSLGNNPQPIIDITTPLNNSNHYSG